MTKKEEYANLSKERVYDLMTGSMVFEKMTEREKNFVEDEFADGMPCERLYQEVYEARCRLCKRFDVSEDPDVELIIDNLLNIGKRLSMKMFEYGALYGTNIEEK